MEKSVSQWKKGVVAGAFAAVAAFGTFNQAQAARVYQFSGKVTGMNGDSISLKKGSEVLEFRKEELGVGSGDLSNVKVGDAVTIWYRLDALKAKALKSPSQQPGQQPGQAAPATPDLKSGEKKGIIQDDRAFYDARNDRNGSAVIHPHG